MINQIIYNVYAELYKKKVDIYTYNMIYKT